MANSLLPRKEVVFYVLSSKYSAYFTIFSLPTCSDERGLALTANASVPGWWFTTVIDLGTVVPPVIGIVFFPKFPPLQVINYFYINCITKSKTKRFA